LVITEHREIVIIAEEARHFKELTDGNKKTAAYASLNQAASIEIASFAGRNTR